MKNDWMKFFIKSAGTILLAAALARFLIAAGNASFLSLPDPALGIPLRYGVLTVGGIELVIALICLFGRSVSFQSAWLAWLATNFIIFQAGLFWMHCHPQATCIGSLTDPLHLSRGTTGMILAAVPIYLAVGGYVALLQLWFVKGGNALQSIAAERSEDRSTQSAHAEFLKISCPFCSGHIAFPMYGLGQTIACPHCAKGITLQMPV
jgi:hypothetical protein